MKYTPGPWFRADDRQVKRKDGTMIATAWWFGNKGSVPECEAIANNYLIAAAPEMYEALNSVCKGLCDHDYHTAVGLCKDCIVQDAIKKAEGGTVVKTGNNKTEKSGVTINVKANTLILQKQIKVIIKGLDFIAEGLSDIDRGCEKCGNLLLEFGTVKIVDGIITGICSECGSHREGIKPGGGGCSSDDEA